MTALSLLSARALAPLDSRRYVIERKTIDHRASGFMQTVHKWEGVAYAMSTREADFLMTRLIRYSGGRYRAIEQRPKIRS